MDDRINLVHVHSSGGGIQVRRTFQVPVAGPLAARPCGSKREPGQGQGKPSSLVSRVHTRLTGGTWQGTRPRDDSTDQSEEIPPGEIGGVHLCTEWHGWQEAELRSLKSWRQPG